MKLAKMSMVAALLLGANAYAIDNVKVNGNAKLYYGTEDSDATGAADMFDKDASYGDLALELGVTADLTEGVSAGATFNAVSTLGLENNLVSGTWSNAHSATAGNGAAYASGLGGAQVDDASWFSEAWIAGTAGKTTAKVGRQALDTPLAFTETWGIDKNTFEAAVLINQDIADTTLVAGWIGKSNGSANDPIVDVLGDSTPGTYDGTYVGNGTINALGAGAAGYVAEGGKFNTFAKDGAYAFGAINNSVKPLTAQAWYYDLQGLAQAYWLQADLDMEGILAGAQYTNVDVDITGAKDDTAYALMLGYAMKDVMTIKAAYSSVDDEGTVGVANTATGSSTALGRNGSGAKSKLYTEMWWSYGAVSTTGSDSYSLTAEGTAAGVDLLLGLYYADIDPKSGNGISALEPNVDAELEVTEVAFTASKSYGPLDTTLALIYDDLDATATNTVTSVSASETTKVTTLQVYLTYNF